GREGPEGVGRQGLRRREVPARVRAREREEGAQAGRPGRAAPGARRTDAGVQRRRSAVLPGAGRVASLVRRGELGGGVGDRQVHWRRRRGRSRLRDRRGEVDALSPTFLSPNREAPLSRRLFCITPTPWYIERGRHLNSAVRSWTTAPS